MARELSDAEVFGKPAELTDADVFGPKVAAPPADVSPTKGFLYAGLRGIKQAQGMPDVALLAASENAGKPTVRQEFQAFTQAMADPNYQDRLAQADPAQAQKVESLFGPSAKVELATRGARTAQEALIADVAENQAAIHKLPMSAAQRQMAQAATDAERFEVWKNHPIELTASIMAESMPPSIAGAAIGTATMGPGVGTAIGAGASSGLMTFASELLGEAERLGYDTSDAASLRKFLADKKAFNSAFNTASAKAGPVGVVDAATAGAAGKWMEPALKQGLGKIVGASAKELGLQMAGGAGGEAAGEVLSGQPLSPFNIAMEAVAEVGSAPGEVFSNLREGTRLRKESAPSERPPLRVVRPDLEQTSPQPAYVPGQKLDTPIEIGPKPESPTDTPKTFTQAVEEEIKKAAVPETVPVATASPETAPSANAPEARTDRPAGGNDAGAVPMPVEGGGAVNPPVPGQPPGTAQATLPPAVASQAPTVKAPGRLFAANPNSPFMEGDEVAFQGNFGLTRGRVFRDGDGVLKVAGLGEKEGLYYPLHDGWKPNAEVKEPADGGVKPYTRESFDLFIREKNRSGQPNELHVPQVIMDEAYDLITKLRQAMIDRNVNPDAATSNGERDSSLIQGITGSLTRWQRQQLSIDKGYKRGNEQTRDGAIQQLQNHFDEVYDRLGLEKPERKTEVAPAKEIRRGEVGGELAAGEVVRTSSGRTTTPFPKIDLGGERKALNTNKRVEAWLQANALAEAESRGDEFNARQFRNEKPGSIPQASKDAMEEYLFGEQPPVVPSILKPLRSPEPAPAPKTEVKSPLANLSDADRARAEELKKRLRGKFGNMNSAMGGFDPEIATIAAELGSIYVKGGVKTFGQFAARVKEELPDVWSGLKVYLRGVWNQLADISDLPDVSKAEADAVLAGLEQEATEPETKTDLTTTKPLIDQFVERRLEQAKKRYSNLPQRFLDGPFRNVVLNVVSEWDTETLQQANRLEGKVRGLEFNTPETNAIEDVAAIYSELITMRARGYIDAEVNDLFRIKYDDGQAQIIVSDEKINESEQVRNESAGWHSDYGNYLGLTDDQLRSDYSIAAIYSLAKAAREVENDIRNKEDEQEEQGQLPAPPQQPDKKAAEEQTEVSIVAQAREIVRTTPDKVAAFRKLVELYNSQPRLGTRTVTSKTNQAYSTPPPLAFAAGILSDMENGTRILEPTAGNGMLLITAPEDAAILANELDPARAANLENIPGKIEVTKKDAASSDFFNDAKDFGPDRLIANPPFGGTIEGNEKVRFTIINAATSKSETPSIDLAIALNSLETLAPNGKAAIIIGAKTGSMGAVFGNSTNRAKAYNRPEMLEFFQRFNVVDWFTVDGSLYGKMGAGWPVDVIVIDGKRPTLSPKAGGMVRPWMTPPLVLKSWQELESKINERGSGTESSRPSGGTSGGVLGGRPGGDSPGTARPNEPTGTTPAVHPEQRPEKPASTPGEAGRPDIVPAGGATKPTGSAGVGRPAGRPSQGGPSRPAVGEGKTLLNVPYVSVSKNADPKLVAPANLADAQYRAVQNLEAQVGMTVDEYTADRMGWTVEQLYKYLSSAQIESVALFIRNSEKRQTGLISADQTGVGKGRQVATVIAYALRHNLIPIFLTQGKHLYSDMAGRDLAAIGVRDFVPFITDSQYAYENGRGEEVNERHTASERRETMQQAAAEGTLPSGFQGIFSTYYQLQADKPVGWKEEPKEKFKRKKNLRARPDGPRLAMLRALAPKAIFVLDEAHMAAGLDSDVGLSLQSILQGAAGVFYASATFAKRPDNLMLYALGTSLDSTGLNAQAMAEMFKAGGIPLQQALTSMLTEEGEFVRREQNMEGVKISFKSVSTDTAKEIEVADTYTSFLRDLHRLADMVNAAAAGMVDSGNQARPEEAQVDLSSINFGARLFNLSNQYLFSLRSGAAADAAIEALNNKQKPFITVYNTMEGPMADLKTRNLPINFGGLLRREMLKMLEVKVKDPLAPGDPNLGLKKGERLIILKPEDLADGGAFFYELERQINSTDFGAMPISPIDAIKKRIREAKRTIGEITAREGEAEEENGTVTITKREKQERNKILSDYNNGVLDALIVNGSGSTGLSAHTDPKFKDQRQRHLIVAQPAPDINVFMQTLGRVMRFGQLSLPEFTVLTTALAAERRFMTMLRGKLTSLNANTSAETESGITQGGLADDIFNVIGDEIVYEVMRANPELALLADIELPALDEEGGMDNYARYATGRFVLLPNEDADKLWKDISEIYIARIKSLDEAGENPLKANVQDLRAKTTGTAVLNEGQHGDTAFDGPVILERASIQPTLKPFTFDEATKLASENEDEARDNVDAWLSKWRNAFQERIRTMREREMTPEQIARTETTMRGTYDNVTKAASMLGKVVGVDPSGSGQPTCYAVPIGIELRSKETGDYSASSRHSLVLATNTLRRRITVPLSQLATIIDEGIDESAFESHSESVAVRYIATGNLLVGYDAAINIARAQGLPMPQVTMFTTRDGSLRTGVLLPARFNPAEGTGDKWAAIPTAQEFETRARAGETMQAGPVKIVGRKVTVPSRSEQKNVWGDRNFNDLFPTSPVERRGEFEGIIKPGYEQRLYDFLKGKNLPIVRKQDAGGGAIAFTDTPEDLPSKGWGTIDTETEDQRDTTYNEALATGDVDKVLDAVAQQGTEAQRELALKLKALNLGVSIKRQTHDEFEAENGYRAPEGSQGIYTVKRNAVVIFDNSVNQAHDILHELMHAATVGAIKSSPKLQAELTELFNLAAKNAEHLYGATNGYEFVAEAFSNPEFQEHLRSIQLPERGTLWQRFVNFLRRVLGMSERYTNVLNEAVRIVTPEMRPTRAGESSDVLPSKGKRTLADEVAAGKELEDGEEDYIPTVVFGRKMGVLGKTQWTPQEQAKSRAIAKAAYDEAGLTVVDDSTFGEVGERHWQLVNQGHEQNAEGRKLIEIATREISKYGQGSLEVTELVQSIVLNFHTGRMEGIFSPAIRFELDAIAQGERSFRGVALAALRGAGESLKFVSQNIDIVLKRIWHSSYGGAEVDDVITQIRDNLMAFFTPEVLGTIAKGIPGLAKVNDAPGLIGRGLKTNFANLEELQATYRADLKAGGLDEKTAEAVAKQIIDALKPKIREKAGAATRDVEGKLTGPQRAVIRAGKKPIWLQIVEAVGRGEFDNGPLLRAIAMQHGWRPPSDAEIARIKNLAKRERDLERLTKSEIEDIKGDPVKLARAQAVREESTLPERLPLMRAMEAAWGSITRPVKFFGAGAWSHHRANNAAFANELVSANLLFRASFPFRQAISIFTQFITHVPTRAVGMAIQRHAQAKSLEQQTAFWKDVDDAMKGSIKAALAGYKDGVAQFVAALRGRGEARNVDRLMSGIAAIERIDAIGQNYLEQGKIGMANLYRLFALIRLAYRVAQAFDNLHGVPSEYAEMRHQAVLGLMENGRTRAEAQAEADNVITSIKAGYVEAVAEARNFREANGMETSPQQLREIAHRIARRWGYNYIRSVGLPADAFQAANKQMRETIGWNEREAGTMSPGGIVGWAVAGAGKVAEKVGVPLDLGRFGNAIAISINRGLHFTPFGFFPAVFGENNAWYRTELDRNQRKVEAAVGSTVGTVALMLAFSGVFIVRLKWPKDKKERDLFEAQGHRPGTVEIPHGDGTFSAFSLNTGPMAIVAPYLAAGGALRDLFADREAAQEKLNAEAERKGLVPEKIRPMSVADMAGVAGQAAYQTVLGGRTTAGMMGSISDFGTLNVTKAVAGRVGSLVPMLPGVQEVSRMSGVVLDSRTATFMDFLVPMPTSSARRVNMLGDPSGTPDDMQRIIQTLTGGTYLRVNENSPAAQRAYEVLMTTGYRPPSIDPNKGYAMGSVFRPFSNKELERYTKLRGDELKAELGKLPPNADAETVTAAYKAANSRALRQMGVTVATPATSSTAPGRTRRMRFGRTRSMGRGLRSRGKRSGLRSLRYRAATALRKAA